MNNEHELRAERQFWQSLRRVSGYDDFELTISHTNNADETATIEIQVVCNNKRISVRRLDTGENSVRMYLAAINQLFRNATATNRTVGPEKPT